MPSVCFYFQVHQPYRVGRFTYFDSSSWRRYFDDEKNADIMRKVSEKCYIPANQKMLELIHRFNGAFRISYSISGVALEQMRYYAPEALESFVRLAETGCVEFLGETYHHSLASIHSRGEFESQVRYHSSLIQDLFGQQPSVFRNTELIYDDGIGRMVSDMGFSAILAEGADDILGWRSPNFVYSIPGRGTRLLVKNYSLSDDIAFRFSNQNWKGYPLTATKFAGCVHNPGDSGDIMNLFMDYETFGEHQWAETGIFEFLDALPAAILADPGSRFCTPSEIINRHAPVTDLHVGRLTSWADADRDVSAWCGNQMQRKALYEVFQLEEVVTRTGNLITLDTWRKLQQSDHFYYMSTKPAEDGEVHHYFSPFPSPYDAFLNYMNVLKDFRSFVYAQVENRQEMAVPKQIVGEGDRVVSIAG
jgi:alpha-amylase